MILLENIIDDNTILYFSFFDAMNENNHIITKEKFENAKKNQFEISSEPKYGFFDYCCKEYKKFLMVFFNLVIYDLSLLRPCIIEKIIDIIHRYRVEQQYTFLFIKDKDLQKYKLNSSNFDFWYSRKTFYFIDEQDFFRRIIYLIKIFQENCKISDFKAFENIIDLHINLLRDNYKKSYAKYSNNILRLQDLVKKHNYSDIKKLHEIFCSENNVESDLKSSVDLEIKTTKKIKYLDFKTYLLNLYRNEMAKINSLNRNFDNLLHRIFVKCNLSYDKLDFFYECEDGFCLKYYLCSEKNIKEESIKILYGLNELNKKLCTTFLKNFEENFEAINTTIENTLQTNKIFQEIYLQYCDYNCVAPKDLTTTNDKILIKTLDRISCSLVFSDSFGDCLSKSINIDLDYIEYSKFVYDQIFREINIEDLDFSTNKLEAILKYHEDEVEKFKDKIKLVLKNIIDEKKIILNSSKFFLQQSEINENFKFYVKNNILSVIKLSFMFSETSNAALNITKIIDSIYSSEKNQTSVGLFNKIFFAELSKKNYYGSFLQSIYKTYNLSSLYFLSKCDYVYLINTNEYTKNNKLENRGSLTQNKNLSTTTKNNIVIRILFIIFAVIIIAVSFYIYYIQKIKNKQLI
ncbi:hypothetical protein GVAV_002778 [Gurleya vavrai]